MTKQVGNFNVDFAGEIWDGDVKYQMVLFQQFEGDKPLGGSKCLYFRDEKGYEVPRLNTINEVVEYFVAFKNNVKLSIDATKKVIRESETQSKILATWAYGLTRDDAIDMAKKKGLDIVSQIQEEIMTDDHNDTWALLDLYEKANKQERCVMDALLIDLCGYSMGSIIHNAYEAERILEDFEPEEELDEREE